MAPPDAAGPAAQRLHQLSAITEAALAHLELDRLLDVLLERLRDILAVDTAAILLLDADASELTVRAAKGLEESVARQVRIPVGGGFAGRVAAERRAIFIPDVDQAEILNPVLRDRGLRSLLGVPLVVEGEVTGVVHVGSLEARDFTGDDAELLQLAADRMALAIDHARLFEAERSARAAAERRAEELDRIRTVTDAALGRLWGTEEVLGAMLERVREVLSVDTAAILLVAPGSDELVARAARGLEEEVELGVRIPIGGGFAGRIAAERRPVILEDVDHAEVLNPLLREKGIRSMLGVPLLVEDRVLGVMHVGTLTPRDFGGDDVGLLERAADRIAIAIDRGRHHTVAEVLQRSLLPEALPALPGVSLSARYLPGVDEAHVGGDWYDVIPLPEGRVGLAIGDVVSRGLRAAAAMGQMRTALRAYALDHDSPGKVLDRLDRLIRGVGGREMATVAYLMLEPAARRVSYALAGHPPPLVISCEGGGRFLDAVCSRPIGVAAARSYDVAETELEPGDTILLYTDGVVEDRDRPLDDGLELLRRAATERVRHPEELLADLEALAGDATDDIALLAARLPLDRAEPLRLRLDARPDSLGPMRTALRDWLDAAEAGADEAYDILVAVGEAAANAIEHAYGPADAHFEIDADLDAGAVLLTVRDEGRWRPARGEHRGRGLDLIGRLMHDVDVATTETGTEVRMRRTLGAEVAS